MKKAFTLIELLIVVAIIAILAAIAVPNFLEAQMRAKVSRTKSDMRTLATSLEAYAIDFNKYPAPIDFGAANASSAWNTYQEPPFHSRVPSVLTTPVAYLTSLPGDTFRDNQGGQQLGVWVQNFRTRHIYFNFQYFRRIFPTTFTPPTSTNFEYAEDLSGSWFFYSVGPDKDEFNRLNFSAATNGRRVYIDYDPTNGTVSQGNIFRTQKSGDKLGAEPFFLQ